MRFKNVFFYLADMEEFNFNSLIGLSKIQRLDFVDLLNNNNSLKFPYFFGNFTLRFYLPENMFCENFILCFVSRLDPNFGRINSFFQIENRKCDGNQMAAKCIPQENGKTAWHALGFNIIEENKINYVILRFSYGRNNSYKFKLPTNRTFYLNINFNSPLKAIISSDKNGQNILINDEENRPTIKKLKNGFSFKFINNFGLWQLPLEWAWLRPKDLLKREELEFNYFQPILRIFRDKKCKNLNLTIIGVKPKILPELSINELEALWIPPENKKIYYGRCERMNNLTNQLLNSKKPRFIGIPKRSLINKNSVGMFFIQCKQLIFGLPLLEPHKYGNKDEKVTEWKIIYNWKYNYLK
ncbi:hypothetical protein Mgra_00007830 [Meloidogyne graminicola]|uniref:Uncharacterized protein n=1 Tax=Meloidogyne graminicola TaxID=189291 RepID=A0A8S9ZHM5_9BILA|nr:hypothetical protein Mgra_00007830 [Meloidogyne graminicola]